MAKLTSIRTVEQEDGALNLFIGNGLPLVIGSQAQKLSTQRSAVDSSTIDITISQTGAGTPTVITSFLSGGRIGGLTRFQDEMLNPAQNQLGLVALGIAEQINEQHKLGVDLNGDLGGDFFTIQNIQANPNGGNTGTGEIDLNIENVGNLTGDEYRLTYNGTDYQLTRLSDSKLLYSGGALPTGEVMDGTKGQGFSLDLASGTVNAGDSFLIRPTHSAASNMRLAITDIKKIAAAGGLTMESATANTGTARLSQPDLVSSTGQPLADLTLTFANDADGSGNPGFLITGPGVGPDAYVLYTGSQFSFEADFGQVFFTMQGTPVAGDVFDIKVNTDGAVADNRNATAMAEMHNQNLMLGGTTTYVGTFSKMVAQIGTESRQVDIAYQAQSNLLDQALMANSEISGVNLDEEASNLLRYQQAYQAAAQLISIANSTFQSLLAAVRG
jgi:flagellar hook-associated protein 1 FlgK